MAEVECVFAGMGVTAPELPGLHLVDPDISNWQGQIVYLDFDGEQNITYNGPITIGPFNIPAFQAPGKLVGRETEIIIAVTASLNDEFAGTGVVFTLDRPEESGTYSTIYIGGQGSWAGEYGLGFLGIAETTDVANVNRTDHAFVFSSEVDLSFLQCPTDSNGYPLTLTGTSSRGQVTLGERLALDSVGMTWGRADCIELP